MRKRPPLLRTVLLLAAIFVAAVAAVSFFVRIDRVVVAKGAFTGPSQPVRAPRDGVIVEALIEPGTRVAAGDVLAKLDTRAISAAREELAARRASITTRRDALVREKQHLVDVLQLSEREELARAIEVAKLVLDTAKTKEERFAKLTEQGLSEKALLEDAVLARKLSESDLAKAQAAEREHPALEAQAQATLDARIAEQTHALEELAAQEAEQERLARQSELVAPVAGCVLGPSRTELAGRSVHAGEEVLRVAVAGVEAFVAHADDRGRARVKSGAKAKLRLEGYPWLVHGTLDASVALVADRADEHGWLVRLTIDPEHSPGPLYEGMSGQARIATDERASIGWLVLEELFGLESK